jgi:hypothetical protein
VDLTRTNLIMETGPYGGSGSGGASSGSFSTPVSTRRFNTWPFVPNAKLLMQKEQEAIRRRNRLRELALGWFVHGPNGGTNGNVSSGAAPGKIF